MSQRKLMCLLGSLEIECASLQNMSSYAEDTSFYSFKGAHLQGDYRKAVVCKKTGAPSVGAAFLWVEASCFLQSESWSLLTRAYG